MVDGCGVKVAKVILIIFNILFWLSGIGLIILGALFATNASAIKYQQFLVPNDPAFLNTAYAAIGVGCFIFVFGFCGCCGAWKENKCLLGVYIALLVLVMAAELAFGIFIAIRKNMFEDVLKDELRIYMRTQYPPENAQTGEGKNAKAIIDEFQLEILKCCGSEGPGDWTNSYWFKNQSVSEQTMYKVPFSCCPNGAKGHGDLKHKECNVGSTYYQKGCYEGGINWIKAYFPIFIGVGCGIAGLEIIGLICAICLCCAIRKEKYV